ncbi:MAG: hypothetical protein GXX84_11760 [Acidobacteria bacterium]|nr:hypothetical protein [Acidobacteriota bacterium]
MEETLIDVLKWTFAKSDPMLAACILILAYLIYLVNRRQNRLYGAVSRRIDEHLSPHNRYPHVRCEWGENSYQELSKQLALQRQENREDHQEIFALLRGTK